jgi:acetoin utilization protein AcuB
MGLTFSSLIDAGYPVFGIDDSAVEAARRLADGGLASAPVVDGGRYVGMATLAGLLGGKKVWPSSKTTLRSLTLDAVPAFGQDADLFDSLRAIVAVGGGLIPVVDEDGLFEGVVTERAIIAAFAAFFHPEQGIASVEIEVPPPGARLSEMIAAIEKNDATIVSFSSKPSGTNGEGQILFFRVMTHDFFRLVRNLEKYGYLLGYHSPFSDTDYDEMREKALEFIRYIDM